MLAKPILNNISQFVNQQITEVKSISGGDISTAYLITSENTQYFLKTNTSKDAFRMFQAESLGLKAIEKTKTIKTPEVYACDQTESGAFILMEFIRSKSASSEEMNLFGNQLAKIHSQTSEQFGFEEDNFIGSLDQSNMKYVTWTNFYVQERLIPQLKIALDNNLMSKDEIPNEEVIENGCNSFFKNVQPSLLHGDLWSGNFLISETGQPVLIDPAVYYGHSEVDIAMSKLFGGFGQSFYKAYHDINRITDGFDQRIELYQLYYLLVHLNLFGSSYKGAVMNILKHYF